MAVLISSVELGSPAQRAGICDGDILLSINGNPIEDVLDYRYYMLDCTLTVSVLRHGVEQTVVLHKEEYDETGMEFNTYLMDDQKGCKNKCMFCFIDQLPKGLRESLYFKDDDSRLSFLFGNYITLTNLSAHEIMRIKKLHISPINISVHTTNGALRVAMMKNPRAGEVLSVMKEFADSGITMNCQLVLCPQVNDGEELTRSLTDLAALYPAVQSIAAVPVGITKFRDGLPPITSYTKEQAADVIDRIEAFGNAFLKEHGTRLCYPGDEFYLIAKRPLPKGTFYEEYAQIQNGVGMWTSFKEEFEDGLSQAQPSEQKKEISVVTGRAAEPLLKECVTKFQQKYPHATVHVYGIDNDFFGHTITVTGLLTGGDILAQLQQKPLGQRLLLSASCLRHEQDLFLDDISLCELEQQLNTQICLTQGSGYSFLEQLMLE